jgi:hypothetical protein
MKLERHRIGGERSTRQSRPLDRAFALLDPLLARPALVVEGNDALGRANHVRHDEADAGIKFCGIDWIGPLTHSSTERSILTTRNIPRGVEAAWGRWPVRNLAPRDLRSHAALPGGASH